MKLSKMILTGCISLILSCQRQPLPIDSLAKIITELLIADQQIMDNPALMLLSDTSLVYASLLQAHGYSTDVFLQSVTHHIHSPEKLKKALQRQRNMLATKKTALEQQQAKLHKKSDVYPPFPPDSLLIPPSLLLYKLRVAALPDSATTVCFFTK